MSDTHSRCLAERKPPGTKKVASTGRENVGRFVSLFIVAKTFFSFFLFFISINLSSRAFHPTRQEHLCHSNTKTSAFCFLAWLKAGRRLLGGAMMEIDRGGVVPVGRGAQSHQVLC